MAKREIGERIDGKLTVDASPPCPKAADLRRDLDAAHDRRAVRSLVLLISDLPTRKAPPARAPAAVPLADERRQLERDLHDRVQNELVALDVKLALAQDDAGIPRRGIEEARAAIYFACSEAIQDVATHAGRAAQIRLGLHHSRGTLAVRIADDGRGVDLAQTPDGVGLRNICGRVQPLDGTLRLTSTPRHGTVPTISLPWPSGSDAYQR